MKYKLNKNQIKAKKIINNSGRNYEVKIKRGENLY
jgi:hypothetical protein